MSIPSSIFKGIPVFHTFDLQWHSENMVTITFLPKNEPDPHMNIAGHIPYPRASADNWFQSLSMEEVMHLCHNNIWDPATKKMFSTIEADIYNLPCRGNAMYLSDESTITQDPYNAESAGTIQIDVLDVKIKGKNLVMYT
jgi:hypothetical protein